MEDFKKRKMNAENEYEFADLLEQYGETVKAVDAALAKEKLEKDAELEEKIKARRQKRRQEIEDAKAKREAELQKETVEHRSELTNQMD